MLRQLERVLGVLSGGVGIGCLLYAVFGPTYVYERYRNGVTSSGTESWLQVGIGPISVVYLSAMATLFIAVPVLALRHAAKPGGITLAGLWAVTVLLLTGTIIGAAGIGLIVAAATLAALLTVIVATFAAWESSGPTPGGRLSSIT